MGATLPRKRFRSWGPFAFQIARSFLPARRRRRGDAHSGGSPKLMPSLDAFIAWVRKPGPGQMPVYTAKVLTDADLTLIYAYLSSLHAPTSIPAVLTHP